MQVFQFEKQQASCHKFEQQWAALLSINSLRNAFVYLVAPSITWNKLIFQLEKYFAINSNSQQTLTIAKRVIVLYKYSSRDLQPRLVNPNNPSPYLPRHESGRADNEFIDDYGSDVARVQIRLCHRCCSLLEPSLFRSSLLRLSHLVLLSFHAIHVTRVIVLIYITQWRVAMLLEQYKFLAGIIVNSFRVLVNFTWYQWT